MPDKKPKTILIVDDDVSVSEYLDVAIKSAGHKTILAFDGEQAVKRFKQHKPDLVLLDALLPKMDGFEVCRAIKADRDGRSTPIVMMTGIYTKRTYRQQALNRSGALEYIVKPLGISEIWRILRDHLGISPQDMPKTSNEAVMAKVDGEQEVSSALQSFFQNGEMSLGKGEPFSKRPLAVVLRDLYLQRRTGLLFLRSEKNTSIFYVDRGQIVFVRSNDVQMRLDRILVKMNKISDAEYEKAQELFKAHRGKRRMGEILTGIGILSEEDLREALRFQLQLLVARVFRWKEGTAYFVEGDLPNREDIVANFDTRAIIFSGIKNMNAPEAIAHHIPQDHVVLRRTSQNDDILDRVGVTAFERQILSVVDGTKSVRQIRSMGRLANVDIEALLFAFLCTGLVQEDKVNSELRIAAVEDPAEQPKRRAFKGDLVSRPIAKVLYALYKTRKTGILTVQIQGVRKWLQIERGEVIFAGSDDLDDRIGRVLVRANLISEEDLERALTTASHKGGKRIGRVLVDGGHITLEELYWAVVFQVQRIVMSVFSWKDGTYLFREGPLPTRESITLELNTLNLILEGIRSMPNELVEVQLPSDSAVLTRKADWRDSAQELGFSASEMGVLEAMPSSASLADLASAEIAPLSVLQHALYAFCCVGLLDVAYPEGYAEPAIDSEELAVAVGGAPASATSRPGPRPALPPTNAPIPFPGTAPPPVQGTPASHDGQQVPKFLYDELIGERRELEDQVMELYSENCELHLRTQKAREMLSGMLRGKAKKIRRTDLELLLELLEESDSPPAIRPS